MEDDLRDIDLEWSDVGFGSLSLGRNAQIRRALTRRIVDVSRLYPRRRSPSAKA